MKLWNTEIRRGGTNLPAVLVAVLMVSGPGCASLQLLNLKTDKISVADAEHPAIEVLAVWQAAEGPGIGGIPTRGFAGQLFFFTQDRASPVAVDGTARIYVFDDHGSPEQQARPLRQFDFDRQSWTAHLQGSKLGPTYGVFIPYPRNDYHQAICSLRVRFTPSAKGRPLFSTSSTIVLPGPPLKVEAQTTQASPLDALAKKLQSQSLNKPAWKPSLVDTDARPFATNSQIAAAQGPESAQMASGDRPTVALLPAPNAQVAPEDSSNLQAGSSLTPFAYSQAGRGLVMHSNPIAQTAGTTYSGQAQANGAVDNTAGTAAVTTAEGVSTSGRIKLQAASADTGWSSDPEGLGNTDTQRTPDATNGPPVVRPPHPLAD